jgi:hypothetical protein
MILSLRKSITEQTVDTEKLMGLIYLQCNPLISNLVHLTELVGGWDLIRLQCESIAR